MELRLHPFVLRCGHRDSFYRHGYLLLSVTESGWQDQSMKLIAKFRLVPR